MDSSLRKQAIPVIAYMAVHNGADFIRQSIESVIGMVDKLVILEGAWGENVAVNGQPRSTDGTLDIIGELQEKHGKIDLWQYNEASQLAQRNKVFDHIPDDCWLFILDHDEVWEPDQLSKLWMLLQHTTDQAIKVKSFTFVNDPYTYVPIAFPRCFRIRPGHQHFFSAPNDLVRDGKGMIVVAHEDITFFHYSYCHSPERFLEKKRERTKLNGYFLWSLEGDKVVRPDANLRHFDEEHPEIMNDHPLMQKKPSRNGDHYVIIQHSGIGNLIHVTPLAKSLRELFPRAKISILTWPRSARILEGWPVVDEVWVGDPNAYFRALKTPVKEVLISVAGTLPLRQEVLRHSIMKLKFKAPWTMHETEYNMMFARDLGWGDKEAPWSEVHLEPSNRTKAKETLEDKGVGPLFLAVNACYLKSDHWWKKHWGNKNYAQLLKWFVDKYNWDLVFVGTQADKKDAAAIIKAMGVGKTHNLCGWSNDIKDTAAILESAAITLGNDGGLQHISVAVDTPTVTIFTFTNHVKNQSLHDLAELAMKECEKRLMCQHGGHSTCKCLDVPVATVKAAMEKVIGRVP